MNSLEQWKHLLLVPEKSPIDTTRERHEAKKVDWEARSVVKKLFEPGHGYHLPFGVKNAWIAGIMPSSFSMTALATFG